MPASPLIDPRTNMKAQLAYTLRVMRSLRGLSQDQLAKELYVTRETIAAYESGRNRPDLEFCKKLDAFFDTGEMSQSLWTHAQREHLYEWLETYVEQEGEAIEIRSFQPLYIPGLLQTEGYIRATWLPRTVIEEKVAERLARRDILTRESDPPHLFAVVDEAAILRRVGGVSVMKEQLQHLIMMSELPNVSIQVVRLRGEWYFGLSGALVLLSKADGSRSGYLEAQFGGRLTEDPREVETMHDDPVAEE